MRKHFLIIISCFFTTAVFSQGIGLGTPVPHSSALLDVTSPSKGILIPRMNSAAIAFISNPAKGLMVYDSTKNQLMVNMGTPTAPDWQTVMARTGWNLNGNAGIDPVNQFIGTTDAKPFVIKVNNLKAGYLDSATYNVSFGYRALQSIKTGMHNLAVGYKALLNDTSGGSNVAFGFLSLSNNLSGWDNVAVGHNSLNSPLHRTTLQ